jgi:type IX secretion system PorP/SprF family membrane protein
MKKVLLIIIWLQGSVALAQNPPSFRQFYSNSYLYNPAFAGVHDYAQAGLFYRQQWAGFNNAPSVAGFSLQLPSSNRASFALGLLAQETVALQNNTAQTTFAYRIPIRANQFIFFGLSGVVGFNNLKLDADYSNDPTILNAAANTSYADANFGMIYSYGHLKLGMAFPKLLGQKYYSSQDLVNVRYSQLRNQLYSLSYTFKAGNFSIEPYALYRINRDFQNWWEAATIVYFKEKIWMGGSYHSTQGAGFFLGFQIKEKLRISYSYELPPLDKDFPQLNSHEMQVQIRISKKRAFKWASRFEEKERAEEVAKSEIISPVTPVTRDTVRAVTPDLNEPKNVDQAPLNSKREKSEDEELKVENAEIIKTPARPPVQSTLAPGLYIIAGSFKSIENAKSLRQRMILQGYKTVEMGFNKANGSYYVYLFSSYDLAECRQVRNQLHQNSITKDVWILTIQ